MDHISQRVSVSHISPGQVFKVSFILGAAGWGIFGLLYILLESIRLSSLYQRTHYPYDLDLGAVFVFYVVSIFLTALMSGVVGAVYAWVYNSVVVSMVGGIEVTLEGVARPYEANPAKRSSLSGITSSGAGEGSKVCPECGHKNMSFRSTCENCGADLK